MTAQQVRWGVFALFIAYGVSIAPAWALNRSVSAINGDLSRILLGDGTGVILGIVDSGIDDLHPALSGFDSRGNPRLVAEANFVSSESANTGDDVVGHGTWVASAALSRDATFTGLATDARYVNARALDSANNFPNDVPVKNAIGFAVAQGIDVLNLSLNFFAPNNNAQLDLMIDWIAYSRRISCAVCVGNISNGNGAITVRGPGSAYNGVTVGRTTTDFSRVHSDSATAFTTDGRMKPDVVAPGSDLTLANDDWEGGGLWNTNLDGCSFATPHVAGLMAQQIDAGRSLGLSTDPLVIKATMLNSADKSVLDSTGGPWGPANSANVRGLYVVTQPLNAKSGAGQVDGLALATQYLAGEMAPGLVNPIGWDLNSVAAGQFHDYVIGRNLIAGSTLTATLAWDRHITRTDNGEIGVIDAADTFVGEALNDLNLSIFRNGILVAESISTVDNLEHLRINVNQQSQYTLRVRSQGTFTGGELFALAWRGSAVPEPAAWLLALPAVAILSGRRRELRRWKE